MGMKNKTSNAWNPQSNAISKRIHHVLVDVLRVFDLEDKVKDENEDNPFNE